MTWLSVNDAAKYLWFQSLFLWICPDDALVASTALGGKPCFNPCSYGFARMTCTPGLHQLSIPGVSILVLMDLPG